MNIAKKVFSTPCYIIDKSLLIKNLRILKRIQEKTGCKILLALKGYAVHKTFKIISKYLAGTTASSLFEARLAFEEFGKEVHLCAPAYREDEIDELIKYSSHITFNSFSQWEKYKKRVKESGKKIHSFLRINPEHSEVKVPLYDPCAPNSRMGITLKNLKNKDISGINGLHFHTLCELNSDSLERTLKVVEKKFSFLFDKIDMINFGGGHHITRKDYDINKLCDLIVSFKKKYGLEIYLEPGEAVVLNTGFLVSSVLDIINNKMRIAILDTSAEAHMPDVIAMPYRPEIIGAGKSGEYKYTYRLGGLTCLAGDVIGDYSFKKPLSAGDKITFTDMAHYSIVKNNMFNGLNLPSIAIYDSSSDKLEILRKFGYEDFKNRLS